MQRQLIKALLKRKLGLDLKKIIDTKRGYNGRIYIIKTNEKDLILKFQRKRYHRLINEVRILKELRKLKVPVPRVLITNFKNHFIIEERIEGVTLQDAKLSDQEKKDIMKELGTHVKRIHKVKTNGYGYFLRELIGSKKSWKEYLDEDSFLSRVKKKRVISRSLFLKIENFYLKNKNMYQFNKPRLLHGDLKFDNLIIKNGKLNGIIDAGEAISGDPIQDLACLYDEFLEHEPRRTSMLIKSFKKGYGRFNGNKINFYLMNLLVWSLYFNGVLKKNNKKVISTSNKINKILKENYYKSSSIAE